MVHADLPLKYHYRTDMRILLLFIAACTIVFAMNNPPIYASLGDVIYNNAPKIAKLKNLKEYEAFAQKITRYVSEVNATKKLGFAIVGGKFQDADAKKRIYLNKLRELAKTNDFFVRSAKALFERAIENEDVELFKNIINSELIDFQAHKEEIIDFYQKHKEQIELSGALKKIIDEHEMKKKKSHTPEYYERLRKLKEQEKIRRLREKEKKRQEALQKKLEKELRLKKEKIRQEQLQELQEEIAE